MVLFDLFRNYINALTGRNQEFEDLLKAGDISAVKEKMTCRTQEIHEALSEYNVETHDIMKREDKIITDKNGKFLRREPVWKLPISYQKYINEVSLVFLYGQPVKWLQNSDNTDNAYAKFVEVIKKTRFDSKIRQAKRLAGAETESAMLFRVYRDSDSNPDVQIRVLAASKGDELYTRFDQYENLVSFAWGYYTKEEKDEIVYHFDIFTKDVIYRCAKKSLGWDVEQEPNFIGKIPVILFQQEKEWAGAEPLIHRMEYIVSHTADTNDYFADPIMIMSAEAIKNMPSRKDANKTLISNNKDGVGNVATYLTWDNAPQSKKDEMDFVNMQILNKTFTPDITLDTLKSVSQLSAKALRTVMMLADIKASKHKEVHDEMLDRTASLITAIIGNVLDVSLRNECDNLVVAHEFQEPFGEDVADDLNNIIRSFESGIMSEETAIESNPLVKDSAREKERIEAEKDSRRETQLNIFGNPQDEGASSFFDNDSNVRDNTSARLQDKSKLN